MTASVNPFNLSIEVFPPRDLVASFNLWSTIETLQALDPDFVSVTYGAGGSTKQNTTQAVEAISRKYGAAVAGHLTCVGAPRDHVLSVAQDFWHKGARKLVALRGDIPDAENIVPASHSFRDPIELITAIRRLYDFEFYVAAYPTPHPKAKSVAADIEFLKAKFDAGATAAITQFFFEAEDFLRFRDRCVKAGITQKIIPGILPIENWEKTKLFASRCGVPVPEELDATFGKAQDRETHDLLSTAVATELCDSLLCEGVEDLHFYTLNRASLTLTVCRALGRTPELRELKAAS